MGLSGPVEADQLLAVMSGADPSSGEILSRHRDRVSVAGFDLTFGAPKSASILFALAGTATSDQVMAGHEAAVSAALGYLECHALRGRRRHFGERREVEVNGAVGAAFPHRTSRACDPHLHTHVLVANLVEDRQGRWSAFDARRLYLQARTAGFLYEAHIRHEMTNRLHVQWGQVRNGRSDVAGMSEEVLSAFSRRRAEVEAYMAERGDFGPRAAARAVTLTRAAKNLDVSFGQMQQEWRGRAEALGWGRERLELAVGQPLPTLSRDLGDACEGVLDRLSARGAVFSRRDLLQACCEELRQGAPLPSLERMVDQVLVSTRIRPTWRRDPSDVQERSPVGHGIHEHR
ncbi:MAG: MobF family relaxase, partial [Mycobacterium sp.]